MLVGAADEMIESLDRMPLETKRARETTERRPGFQDGDVMAGANEVKAGCEPRQPTPDDDDALARWILVGAQFRQPQSMARNGATPFRGRPIA